MSHFESEFELKKGGYYTHHISGIIFVSSQIQGQLFWLCLNCFILGLVFYYWIKLDVSLYVPLRKKEDIPIISFVFSQNSAIILLAQVAPFSFPYIFNSESEFQIERAWGPMMWQDCVVQFIPSRIKDSSWDILKQRRIFN